MCRNRIQPAGRFEADRPRTCKFSLRLWFLIPRIKADLMSDLCHKYRFQKIRDGLCKPVMRLTFLWISLCVSENFLLLCVCRCVYGNVFAVCIILLSLINQWRDNVQPTQAKPFYQHLAGSCIPSMSIPSDPSVSSCLHCVCDFNSISVSSCLLFVSVTLALHVSQVVFIESVCDFSSQCVSSFLHYVGDFIH